MGFIVYRFRVTFEDVLEVERVIAIKAGQTFRQLHDKIQEAIGFDNTKPSSFYMSGDNWRKGKEIRSEKVEGVAHMDDSKLNQFVNDPHQKILYITDYDADWNLRVQLVKIEKSEDQLEYPYIFRSVGEATKQYKPVHATDISEFDDFVADVMGAGTGEAERLESLDEDDDDPDDDDLDDDFDEDEGDD